MKNLSLIFVMVLLSGCFGMNKEESKHKQENDTIKLTQQKALDSKLSPDFIINITAQGNIDAGAIVPVIQASAEQYKNMPQNIVKLFVEST